MGLYIRNKIQANSEASIGTMTFCLSTRWYNAMRRELRVGKKGKPVKNVHNEMSFVDYFMHNRSLFTLKYIRMIKEAEMLSWLTHVYGRQLSCNYQQRYEVNHTWMMQLLPMLSVINEMSRDELVFLRRMLRKLSRRRRVNWFAMMDIPLGSGSLLFKRDLNAEIRRRDKLHDVKCLATTAHQAIVAANVDVIPPTTISSCSCSFI